jgi:hypothetical protein
MGRIIFTLLFTAITIPFLGQNISMNELDVLAGSDWSGKLTYLDYSSNEKVSLKVKLAVRVVKEGTYELAYSYPDEPKANSKSKVKISGNGTKLAGNKITKVERSGDRVIIHTESKGSDDNEKAMLYFTYTVASNYFSSKKEVVFAGQDERIMRNEYVFER